jgi:hypothetical protein
VAWLGDGYDPTQHYLGWVFFRQSPWEFPIGLNPQYGLDISSAVVFSDSIPIFAFIFKAFASILPEPFQYIGLWNFLCFVLQAYFAWLILSLITSNLATKILATGFFLISPPMLFRLGLHAALAAHFLILAGLFLNIRSVKKNQSVYWIVLLLFSAWTHFYLFVMVAPLWFADLLDRQQLLPSRLIIKNIFKESIIVFFVLLLAAWQAGYFAVSTTSAATGHYGLYNFNLLAPFQADGWSYIWKDWAHPINGEGFNYFGLGAIGLLTLVLSFGLWVIKASECKHWFLKHRFFVTALLILLLFAMSNRVVVGSWEHTFPIPQWLYNFASILRGSGRLFWPLWYMFLIGAL